MFRHFESHFLKNNLSLLIIESIILEGGDQESMEEFIIYESKSTNMACSQPKLSYPFDHCVLSALSGCTKNKRISRNNRIPYLLSGCIAILSHEPCTMCSMALLHSRIDAVIFYNYNNDSGALGSNCFLHSMESLNHHFPVYTLDKNVESIK